MPDQGRLPSPGQWVTGRVGEGNANARRARTEVGVRLRAGCLSHWGTRRRPPELEVRQLQEMFFPAGAVRAGVPSSRVPRGWDAASVSPRLFSHLRGPPPLSSSAFDVLRTP